MVAEHVEEPRQEEVRSSLDILLDGIGRSTTLDLGLLSFYGCWGADRTETKHWRRLNTQLLADLFGVKDREKADLTYNIECERGIATRDSKKLATFVGEQVKLDVTYRVPADQFTLEQWHVRVLNRRTVVTEQLLIEPEGTIHLEFNTASCSSKYSKKIALRIVLDSGGEFEANSRLDLHLCGKERPAFVVVEPTFEVVDAAPSDEEEPPDKKITVDEPVHLFFFSNSSADVSLCDENDELVDITETHIEAVWKTDQRVDASSEPSGMATRICNFGMLKAILCFEASDLEKGEFTLEDELRAAITGERSARFKDLVDLFKGESEEPYPALGQIDEAARRRMFIAKIMTGSQGWRPLLANLFEGNYESPRAVGNFVNCLGTGEEPTFQSLSLPDDATPLINSYCCSRDAVQKEIKSFLGKQYSNIEHPIYASHPIFVHRKSEHVEELLKNYLESYLGILKFLQDNQKVLQWSQLFVLSYLDCVVHWDGNRLQNAFFLVGPWHPLVLAKRFMVQAALYSRAQRLLNDEEGKNFRKLAFYLANVQGFRWVLSMSGDESLVEPAYTTVTSDPGWHLALRSNSLALIEREGASSLTALAQKLRRNLGLSTMAPTGSNSTLAVTCLSSFVRAFPSRRSIGVRVRRGYAGGEIIKTIDNHIHAEDGPTEQGHQLPGGVRVYFEETPDDNGAARWTTPPLYVYHFQGEKDWPSEGCPDIDMLSPTRDLAFKRGTKRYELPRGRGREVVFSKGFGWLTEGQTLVPKSIIYEFDDGPWETRSDDIGGTFTKVTGLIGSILKEPYVTVCNVDLPEKLNAPWVVVPGYSIDPAILVKYVKDGEDRAIQERALWDYKIDVTGRENSYFVLSTIPKGFQVAINGFFLRDDIAGDFIVELGRIGIAIGGEALRSGRHARGIIGLVGAVRLMVGAATSGRCPLSSSNGTIGFLVPIDSFSSFFGKNVPGNGKRTDLLAVQLVLPGPDSRQLLISACGVEAKFVSKTYDTPRAHAALEQARTTGKEFKKLALASLCQGAMPERLALLDILTFGLRISSPSAPSEDEDWVTKERVVYDAILKGNYEYSEARHEGVLVSTEEELPGAATHEVLEEGLWVRLTKRHWPGVFETPQMEHIRQLLCDLFDTRAPSLRPATSPSKNPPHPEAVSTEQEDGTEKEDSKKSATSTGKGEPVKEPAIDAIERPKDIDKNGSGAEKTAIPLKKILIGADDTRKAVYFDPQSQDDPLDNMNVMVTGSSGKGKTQLLKHLICQLREQGKNVLVLDMKNDFASDTSFCAMAGLDRVFVAFDGLPFNPLIPYPVRHPGTGDLFVQCGQYIAGIASVLKKAYGLGAQQQAAVKNAIAEAFTAAGIPTTGSTPFNDDLPFPDFSNVGDLLQAENPTAYNRLDPLFTLGLFRSEFQAQSFPSLVNRATVLDLSQIPSDEIKNTLAQLVVLSSHAYYNAQPHSGAIRQFLIFDEAHRVLTSEYMSRMVRECRAFGVGIILSSQYPTDFPADISASMATKIVHGNGPDTDRVKGIVQLLGCEGREGDVANLGRFQALADNRHFRQTILRTMNYPLYLIWSRLQELGNATMDELSSAKGFDPSKLPIKNLVDQLERLGLAEERHGKVFLLGGQ